MGAAESLPPAGAGARGWDRGVSQNKAALAFLGVIVAAYLGVGALYAVYTPPWQAPDEPAHYNYIAQVAGAGCCPVIAPGDWDAAYLEALKAAQFPEDADLSPIEYEDHQPPLYYLLASLIHRVTGGSLLALRLFSVILGAGVVMAAYLAGVRLLPHRQPLALAAAAFVAFVPQHIAMLASVNNDSLAELIMGVLLVTVLAYLGNPVTAHTSGEESALPDPLRPHPATLGLMVGLAFLTKLTVYSPAVLAVAVAVLSRWRLERRPARWLLTQAVWAGIPALALGALWWGRNAAVYGWPDFLGQTAHASTVVGQPRTAELVAQLGIGGYLARFLLWTYRSFWGQFGWMAVPMSPRVYLLIGLFLLSDAAGLAWLLAAFRLRPRLRPPRRASLWVLAVVVLATLVNYLYYNLTFVQFQGRYLYTALIPLGLLVAAGLWGWASLARACLRGRHWLQALDWLPLAVMVWLPLLAMYALFRFVVPYLG